jgi:hypothetical protein
MDGTADITNDAASLYRFVESIQTFCELQRGFPAYLEGSKVFLSLIEELSRSTKKYATDFPAGLPNNSDDYRVYRQELRTLRYGWYYVHRFVKPIADADTLHLPGPLINSMVRRLRSVKSFEESKLAILHIRELNYLQVIASGVRDAITQISSFVGSSASFPSDLGLIGIPYSQAKSVFLNSLIAHEIGHFVFEKRQLKDVLAPKIHAILNSTFAPVKDVVLKISDSRRIPTALADWSEELFCDLFAVRFIGPCYSYAFIEIFDLTNYLSLDGGLDKNAAALAVEFSYSHPAYLYRIQKQVEMLKSIDWWRHIRTSKSTCQKILENSESLGADYFSFPFGADLQKYFIDCLNQVLTEISALIEESLGGLDTGVTEYSRLSRTVKDYLLEGVVPSTIRDPDSGKRTAPETVTVLNSAYQLYLDDLPELIGRIEGQKATSVEHRARWTENLENWTLKALDDLTLMSAKTVV